MTTDTIKERTFVLIKPDGIQRSKAGEILSRFERKGLRLVAMKMLRITRDQAERQYACHKGKEFYDSLVAFMLSGPVIAMILEGRNAVAIVRKLMGATNPLAAEPGTIRGDMALDTKHNLVHGSDSAESYALESAIYFGEQELLEYDLSIKDWLYYT
ncbi:MAG TPA: nucleoside-diphosphate kinase [Candidatus Ozemobacteraceae bacterium]